MEGLREMLLKEQIRLERICRQAEERLKDVPLGKLRLSSSHHSVQYYHCVPGEKKKGRYMSRTEQELARKLAQKSYDEKFSVMLVRPFLNQFPTDIQYFLTVFGSSLCFSMLFTWGICKKIKNRL